MKRFGLASFVFSGFALSIFAGIAQLVYAEAPLLPSDLTNEQRSQYNEGVESLNSGRADLAADKFAGLVKDLPSSAAAHMAYAASLEAQGKISEAITEFETAAGLKPDNDELLFDLGRVYQRSGNRDKAIRQWERYLWLYRDGKQASYVKESLAMLQKEQAAANVFVDSKGRDDYLDESLSKGAFRWKLDKMPVSVYINNGEGVSAFRPEYDLLLRQCFAEWESATDGKLKFAPADSAEKAQIEVKWTANPADFGNSTEAGEARPQTFENNLYHVEILLCTKGLNGGPVQGFKGTCLHEIGHAIGLSGHSAERNDIMFMIAKSDGDALVLSARDIKTARLLYSISDTQLISYNKYRRNDSPFLHNSNNKFDLMRAYFADGSQAFKAGRYLEAANEWEHALEIKPDTINFKVNIANAYSLQSRLDLKAMDLTKAKIHLQVAQRYYSEAARYDSAASCADGLALIAHMQKNEPEAKRLEAEAADLKKKVFAVPKTQ